MVSTRYLTAREAAETLGVSLPTLYAYVSRGLIRSESADGSRRIRRYRAEDVEVLKQRQEQRANPAGVVENALHWGAPLMESALTLISEGSLYYRGREAVSLSARASVEEVASLLWTGDTGAARELFAGSSPPPPRCQALVPQLEALSPFEACQLLLPLAAVDDLSAYDFSSRAVAHTGARILRMMAAVAAHRRLEPPDMRTPADPGRPATERPPEQSWPGLGGQSRTSGGELPGIADILQRGWAPGDPDTVAPISAALILCADHELNVSSFTARCIASAGSTPYAVVIAGLAALQGVKHGGHVERVEALVREAGTPAGIRAALTSWLRRGEGLPGFGHPLYPEGDPRGRQLLELAGNLRPHSSAVALGRELTGQVRTMTGAHPTVDLGLAILSRALELPPGSALALFALGRTMGWIGHAIEQYALDRIIRPRARYVGVLPEAGP